MVLAMVAFANRDLIRKGPLRLAFVGTLSGKNADMGEEARDGAIMAIEECNDAGGIDGQDMQLLVRDDRQSHDRLSEIMDEMDAKNVVAAIGPVTSVSAEWALTLCNMHEMVMISPTAGAEMIGGKDDYFFRVYPGDSQCMNQLARYAAKRKFRKVGIVIDASSQAHTRDSAAAFASSFTLAGGTITRKVDYGKDPNSSVLFRDMAKQVLADDPDCILLLANANDSAILCQQIRRLNPTVAICMSEWSATADIFTFGGSAVQGCFFLHSFDPDYPAERYQTFRQRFSTRFGYEPGYASIHAYDSARILLDALSSGATRKDMRQTLAKVQSFEGLQGSITFDEYGDVRRELFLMTIRDGAFRSME